MANYFSSTYRSIPLLQNVDSDEYEIGLVHSVILDLSKVKAILPELDKVYAEFKDTDYVDKNALHYGAIKYRTIGAGSAELNEENLPIAFPLSREFLSLPVVGELVKIHSISDKYFYEKVSVENSPNFNTDIQLLLINSKVTKEGAGENTNNSANSYQEVQETGIAESNINPGSNTTIKKGFAGNYFKRNLKTHQLALNEGDTLFQGRFGNSIRFSGYIHDNKDNGMAHPAILIRNGESADNQTKKVYDVVSEDINGDGTSIQITSGQYKTLYNSTNIKVSKEANSKYPSSDQLIGDQIVVNSGRVIISSKTAETFLFSKKTFSIFTDDVVTIDAEKGLNFISHNGNINIKAKGNKNIFLDSNSGGNIFLGKNNGVGDAGADVQRMVMGGELVQILTQLIDAITQQSYATPVGPTATGPVNVATFNALQNRLKNILSARNYLSKS
jgi:hypothetical protein